MRVITRNDYQRVCPSFVNYLGCNQERLFSGKVDPKSMPSIAEHLGKIQRAMDDDGSYPVEYHQTSLHGGRQYASMGIQPMPSILRRALFRYSTELDMENAYPVIYSTLSRLHDIQCPETNNYVEHRESVLSQIPMPRGSAKKAVISLMNGGSQRTMIEEGELTRACPVLTRLENEFRANSKAFIATHPEIASEIRKRKVAEGKPGNINGSIVSHILGHHENLMIETARGVVESNDCAGVLERNDCAVEATTFDGLLVRMNGRSVADLIQRMNEAILEKHHIPIKMVEKSMDSDIEIPGYEVLSEYSPNAMRARAVQRVSSEYFNVDVTKEGRYRAGVNACILGTDGCLQGNTELEITPGKGEDRGGNVVAHCACSSDTRVMGNLYSDPAPEIDWGPNVEIQEMADERVLPIKFGKDKRIILIKAGMCMGKSTQVFPKVLAATVASMRDGVSKGMNVTWLSHRKTLKDSVKTKLREMGMEVGDYLDPEFTGYEKVILVSPESAHRIPDDRRTGLFVLDEVASLCNSFVSVNTNGARLSENWQRIKAMLTEAPEVRGNTVRILGLDAGLEVDARVADLFKVWFPKSRLVCEIKLLRYSYRRPEMARRILYTDRIMVLKDILANKDKRTITVCRTRTDVERVREMMKEAGVPEEECAFFTSKTCDKERARVWADPNTHLAEIRHLVYSSCVQAGCDITLDFDRAYILGGGGGASAADVWQMLGRARSLLNPEVLMGGSGALPSVCWEDKVESCVEHLKNHTEALTTWNSRYEMTATGLNMAPSEMMRLKAYSDAEGMQFLPNFHRLCTMKGFPMIFRGTPPYALDEIDFVISADASAKDVQRALNRAALKELQANGFSEHTLEEIEKRQKTGRASTLDKAKMDIHHHTKHWPDLRCDFTLGEVESVTRHASEIRRYAAITRVEDPSVLDRLNETHKYANLTWKCSGAGPVVGILQTLSGTKATAGDLIDALGATKFSEDCITPAILAEATLTHHLISERLRSKGSVATLSATLKHFGLDVKSSKVRAGAGKRKREYSIVPTVDKFKGPLISKYAKLSDYYDGSKSDAAPKPVQMDLVSNADPFSPIFYRTL